MLALRDFQQLCHDSVLRQWGERPHWDGERETSRTTLANLATSAGKTLIAAHLAATLLENPDNRILFTSDREELLQQPVKKFYEACGIIAGIHRGQDRASAMSRVVCGSIQTLVRRLPPGKAFTHIIDDEAHRGPDARKKIHDAYPEAKVLGLTATAFRKGLADLSDWYETVAFELGTFDLIEEGFITPIKVLTMPLEVDISGVHQSQGDYNQSEVESVLVPHYRAIAAAIKKHAPTRTILAFLPLIRSSQAFVTVMQEEGISARHCDGGSPDRAEILQAFEHGEFQILSNSQVFSTGVDFIRCDCLLNLSPTRSRVEYRQRAGRIMRLHPGVINPNGVTLPTKEERKAAIAASIKPDCLILDLLWQTKAIGLSGPASLLAMNEEEEIEIAERVRKKRTPEELEEIGREVQRDREQKLADELEAQAQKAAREKQRGANLMDARQLALTLHDRAMLNYEPVTAWEKGGATDKQRQVLEGIGINADAVCKGLAVKMLDAVLGRQAKGLAPVDCFAQLRAAGEPHPETCTLDGAIRTLGHSFPMTFGRKYRGWELRKVPMPFWHWLNSTDAASAKRSCAENHPAAFRYMTRVIFPPAPALKTAELPL